MRKGQVPRLSQRHKTILPQRTQRTKRLITLLILGGIEVHQESDLYPRQPQRDTSGPGFSLYNAFLCVFARDTSFSSRPFVALTQDAKTAKGKRGRRGDTERLFLAFFTSLRENALLFLITLRSLSITVLREVLCYVSSTTHLNSEESKCRYDAGNSRSLRYASSMTVVSLVQTS